MFQSLRQNSQIYIFYKGNKPSLNIGSVVNVSMPKPKYPITQTFGQSQEMVIDIIAKVNDVIVNYNSLPATLQIHIVMENQQLQQIVGRLLILKY